MINILFFIFCSSFLNTAWFHARIGFDFFYDISYYAYNIFSGWKDDFFFKSMNSIRNLWLARSGIHFRVYTFWLGTINLLRFFFYVSHILKTISSYLHIFECHFPNPSNMFFFSSSVMIKGEHTANVIWQKGCWFFFFWFANTSDISFVLPISLLFFPSY